MSEPELLDQTVSALLASMASDTPAPGGGAAAAITVAMGAALTGMSARLATRQLDAASTIAERADALRGRAEPLAQADAAAYRRVLEAYRLPRDDAAHRDERVRAALAEATDVPLSIAALGCEVADLALRLADSGNPNLVGDAVTAARLSGAAAGSAATLAQLNLAQLDDDERRRRSHHLEETARALADRAQQPPPG